MPEFRFKEFTAEESAVYDEAMGSFRETINSGKTLREAYERYPVKDEDLGNLIRADFLKVLIAERHFGLKQTLAEIAGALGVPETLIKETHARMLQEVGVAAADKFADQYGSIASETND